MKNPDGEGVLQNQSIAVGDRTEYTKIGCNPVVNGDMLPYGLSRENFRDPKVWQRTIGSIRDLHMTGAKIL